MMIRFIFWFLAFAGLIACSGGGSTNSTQTEETGAGFHFSRRPLVSGKVQQNTCYQPFPNAIPINADPVNSNRRLFLMGDGTYKMTVSFGNLLASMMLHKQGDQLEIYTSDNFPDCLSNRNNFTIASDKQSFTYDNKQHIYFVVIAEKQTTGTQIVVEFPPENLYGMVVRK